MNPIDERLVVGLYSVIRWDLKGSRRGGGLSFVGMAGVCEGGEGEGKEGEGRGGG